MFRPIIELCISCIEKFEVPQIESCKQTKNDIDNDLYAFKSLKDVHYHTG